MRLSTLLVLLSSCAIACGAGPSDSSSTSDRDEIIGGVDAKSASLDAVGALVYDDAQAGGRQLLCTATLIAPDVVLTAKHCAIQKDLQAIDDAGATQVVETRFIDVLSISFAVGSDIGAPKRLVRAASVETCNVPNTGYMGLGCDVAVYRLEEKIEDIRPLEVAASAPSESAIGRRLVAIGFGNQVESATAPKNGTRKLGNVTMRALTGAPMKVLFPSVEAYLDAMREAEGEAYVDNYDAILRQEYERPLLDGYEVFTGAAEGDVQVCHGDSGGPLLEKIDGKLVIQGVASGVVSGVRLPCKFGAVYAVFGPKAQELVSRASSDPCEGIPAEGRCEGDVAVRCTDGSEGPRRVTRTDCSAALQRCIPGQADGSDGGAPAAVSCGD